MGDHAMIKNLLCMAVLVTAFVIAAHGQGNIGVVSSEITSTVAKLPPAASCNSTGSSSCIRIVTDGNSSSDCTVGGGSTRVQCSSNGTVWSALGGSGGGISGLTTSVIPKATAATTIGDSLLDDGLTTANTLTYSGAGGFATTGTLGSWTATEGTAPSGSAGKDIAYADSTAHRFKVNNNNGGTTTFSLFTDNLSVFASTTSAQFLGVISDETGSGLVVGATSPTLVTPILGVASATSIALTGANAGYFQCTQGTAQGHATANTFTFECPTVVTAYEEAIPVTAPANNNSAMLFTNGAAGTSAFVKMPLNSFVISNYTNATTTFSNVTGLSFSVEASTNYKLRCDLDYQTSAATADIKIQWTGPASPTAVTYDLVTEVTGSTLSAAVATAFSTSLSETGTPTTATNFPLTLTLTLINGANAGTVQLQAAATGVGTVTIVPGSCVMQ